MKSHQRLTDFLIVGAMKAGTWSLVRYLKLHPSIHMPHAELHYFDRDDNFKQETSWYSRMLTEGCDYSKHSDALLIGEKTPTYSYQPNCAERIKETLPNVKLIWIFRNPVERTYSNYLHARGKGAELLNFRDSISKEGERIKNNIFKGYVERSKYVIQVERFLEHFSNEQMHFILFEHLLHNPQAELNRVADFLGVQCFEDDLPQQHANKTFMPIFPLSLWCARKLAGYNSKLYKALKIVNYLSPRKKPVIPMDVIQNLESIFEPYNQRLSEITGLDLELWRS